MPFPMPKSASLLAKSMIVEDDPAHRRLRGLVNQAFTPRAVSRLEGRVEALAHKLLDEAAPQGSVDLLPAYALPIPVTIIGELVGVPDASMLHFRNSVRALSQGFSAWNLLRMLLFDMPAAVKLVRELIARKRSDPQDDLLTALIQAEEAGDRLSEDEVVSMVFLLVIAGYETTAHLITNGVLTLLQHPDQLERLRAEPEAMGFAVEEILRHRGPVHGTKLAWATEDVTLHGVTIAKGSAVVPAIGAANHDPFAFEKPDVFDIARPRNHHLGFSHGAHYCLGAQLARMETAIALRVLLARSPNLRLAVRPEELTLQTAPLWHRYEGLPVALG
jgi:cytochrome P450